MRFVSICAEKATWPVTVMCTVLKVSTSGYYAWRKRPESAHDREDVRLGVLIEEAHVRLRATYGSPRVHAALTAKVPKTLMGDAGGQSAFAGQR